LCDFSGDELREAGYGGGGLVAGACGGGGPKPYPAAAQTTHATYLCHTVETGGPFGGSSPLTKGPH